MPKTLAELRAEKAAKLPTRSERICLNLELLAKVQELQAEKADVIVEAVGNDNPATVDDEVAESKARVRKGGETTRTEMPARVAEIDAELAALWDQMREYEGDLTLHGISGARWQDYKDQHPPRDGNKSDLRNGGNVVDTTALMADLGDWAKEWDGEPLADGDWDGWLAERIAPADLAGLVKRVVEMQEARVAIPPKALSGSPATTSSGNDVDSPSTSGSPNAD